MESFKPAVVNLDVHRAQARNDSGQLLLSASRLSPCRNLGSVSSDRSLCPDWHPPSPQLAAGVAGTAECVQASRDSAALANPGTLLLGPGASLPPPWGRLKGAAQSFTAGASLGSARKFTPPLDKPWPRGTWGPCSSYMLPSSVPWADNCEGVLHIFSGVPQRGVNCEE